jgi:glycosyltransferase 2 family protein
LQGGVPAKALALCGLLTAASFAALGCYDVLALGVVAPRRVSPLQAWFCGAVANAMSNTLGFHAVTAAAMRYRLLHRSGLGAADAAAVTAWSWTTLGFGFASVFSLAIMVSPGAGAGQRLAGLVLVCALLLLAG